MSWGISLGIEVVMLRSRVRPGTGSQDSWSPNLVRQRRQTAMGMKPKLGQNKSKPELWITGQRSSSRWARGVAGSSNLMANGGGFCVD